MTNEHTTAPSFTHADYGRMLARRLEQTAALIDDAIGRLDVADLRIALELESELCVAAIGLAAVWPTTTPNVVVV